MADCSCESGAYLQIFINGESGDERAGVCVCDCSCDSGAYLQIFINGESGDERAGVCVYDCSCDSGAYLQIFINGESGDERAGVCVCVCVCDCSCDSGAYLQIFINGESGDERAGGIHLCGDHTSHRQLTTTNPRLLMIFHAQGHTAGKGFHASYQFITGQSLSPSLYVFVSVCLSVRVKKSAIVLYQYVGTQ